MNGLEVNDLGDVIDLTLARIPRNRWVDTLKYRHYPLGRIFFMDAVAKGMTGKHYEPRIRLRSKGTFRFTNLFESTARERRDLMGYLSIPWAFWEDDFTYDDRTPAMNNGGEQLVDELETQLEGTWESIFNGIEDGLVKPPQHSDDGKDFLGLLYWARGLEIDVEDETGGFNGKTIYYQDGTDSTTLAGKDASIASHNRLRNWAATHKGEMNPTLLATLRRAASRTKFGSLPQGKSGGKNPRRGGRSGLLMPQSLAEDYEDLVQHGPDDIGNDAMNKGAGGGGMAGKGLRVRGLQIEPVDAMDDLALQPIIGYNTQHLYGFTLKGKWMRRHPARTDRDSPQVWNVTIDGAGNLCSDNPREGVFIIQQKRTSATQ